MHDKAGRCWGELGLFSLGKKRLTGIYTYLIGGIQNVETDCRHGQHNRQQKQAGNQKIPNTYKENLSNHKGVRLPIKVAKSLSSERFKTWPDKSQSNLCFEKGVGINTFQTCLPTYTILQFYPGSKEYKMSRKYNGKNSVVSLSLSSNQIFFIILTC